MEDETHYKDTGVGLSGKPVEGTPVGDGSNGLLHVASVAQIEAAQKDAEEIAARAMQQDDRPMLKNIERYLGNVFEDCRAFKEDETDTQKLMLDSLNRRNAKYDAEKNAKIAAINSSDVFLGVTGVKCRAFESWVHDIYMNAKRKRTWDLKPTPIATIPPEDSRNITKTVMEAYEYAQNQGAEMSEVDAYQMASDMRADIIKADYELAGERAENMSRKIHDQLTEGGWVKAFSDCIMDISSSKAGILKGPVVRRRKIRSGWTEDKNGNSVPKIEMAEIMTVERVSPLDFFPGRANETVNDGPVCERLTISRSSLVENREEPGYIQKNIEHIAMHSTFPTQTPSTLQSERDLAEGRDTQTPSSSSGPSLPAIEIWCKCLGRDLIDFGIIKDNDGKKLDPLLDYDINAMTIDGLIVYITLNEDELGRRPYSVYGYAKEIGGFWFMGIPELITSEQDIINAAARSMVNNLGIASGPQVIINDVNRFPPGEDITSMHPWKIWQGTNMGSSNAPLVTFFQPDSRSAEMLSVIREATRITDSTLEMPSYSYGNDKVSGAGRTASGLSMLMGSSNRGLKRILLGIDRYIFQTVVERMYDWNMKHLEDQSIKGDMNFISEGIVSLIMREQLADRRMGLLQATNNEFDMKILGLDGRAKILGDAIEVLESDYDDIKPSEEKIQRLIQEETMLQQQRIQKNQIEIEREQALIEREAAVEMEKIDLERQKLMLEVQKVERVDKTANRELDIRASKQSQGMIEKIFEADAAKQQEVDPNGPPPNQA